MKSKRILILVLLVLVVAAIIKISASSPEAEPADAPAAVGATIYRTNEGFSPSEASIKKGESVVFTNAAEEAMWPASDMHPTHEAYPEFDPREPIAPGESWRFVFEREGVWPFHDHLKPNRRGIIRVSE